MKQTLLFILCFLSGISEGLKAQSSLSESKAGIGITYSGLGDNDAFHFKSLVGTGGYDGKGYYSLGITYIHPISKSIDIETGISYSRYTYQFSNASLGPDAPEPYGVKNVVIDIPVTVRWNFLKYFFLNGGLLLGIDAGKENHLDSQTGIGVIIGIGAKYDLKNIPAGLFVNPYYKMHSLLPFTMEDHHQRTDESGFRFGVVYYLP